MIENHVRKAVVALAVAALTIGATGCSTTVDEDDDAASDTLSDTQPAASPDDESATPPDDGAAESADTSTPVAGTVAELLTAIGDDMSRLSAQIGGDGDEDATFATIETTWLSIVDEIEADRPELLDGLQTTIDMARTAVEANRPADADKAFAILTDLIDSYTNDP